jgi:tRNA modification GTPase
VNGSEAPPAAHPGGLSGRIDDTIAAIATAPGSAAIGIVRVSGPEAFAIAARLFDSASGRRIERLPGGRVLFGRVRDAAGAFLDEGVLLTFRAPRSYTGQDAVEFQVHGGPALLRALLAATLHAGARPAEAGEFTLRAVAAGRIDLLRAEAVADLIEARSEAARRAASIGLAGGLSRAIGAIQDDLTALYAEVLAELDYPEEGVPEARIEAGAAAIAARLGALLATARAGRFARHGARLALIGRPNAGKSSLLNALLGYERAIVSPTPGTTRDYLEVGIELGRVSLTAIDTAGLRATDDATEAEGVRRARALAAAADVVVALIDASEPLDDEDRALIASPLGGEVIWVASKSDRARAWSDAEAGVVTLPLSTATGIGLAALRSEIEARLVADAAAVETWVTHERHEAALGEAAAALARIPGAPSDVQGLDLEAALRALARITGRGDVGEESLAAVFARFCVGK